MAVYFVRCREFVKIGYAFDVKQRIADLQIGNPYPLVLMVAIDGDYSLEKSFHKVFKSRRGYGEWFKLGRRIELVVELLKGGARPNNISDIRHLVTVSERLETNRWKARNKERRSVMYCELQDSDRTGARMDYTDVPF